MSTASTSAGAADGPTYPSYLRLDELLALQSPASDPQHPDELLFIIVHQASELWFKAILHELDGLVAAFGRHDTGAALWRLGRINALMRIVSAQLSALDTLPPQRFLQFRGYLGTSSGSQSDQFRAIEALTGRRDEHFVHVVSEHGAPPAIVQRALQGPTLEALFLDLLAAEETTIEELYTGPGPSTLFFLALLEHAGVAPEELYTGPGPSTLFLLAEGLLEYEQQFALWRFKHVQLVERVIGPGTTGTGGTLGAKYLSRTVNQRFFPALWEVRHRLYAGPEAPR